MMNIILEISTNYFRGKGNMISPKSGRVYRYYGMSLSLYNEQIFTR